MSARQQTYLGDGVYAEHDGFGVWLWTDRIDGSRHRVYLEPEVYKALRIFVEQPELRAKAEGGAP